VGYLLLGGAIVAEVLATLCLRASEGMSRPLPAVAVVVGYITAFGLLSMALTRRVPLGIAYGIWAAAGVAMVAALSAVIFGERLTAIQVGGLVLIVLGVVALEMGGASG
jgi:small multidrug resistance pump